MVWGEGGCVGASQDAGAYRVGLDEKRREQKIESDMETGGLRQCNITTACAEELSDKRLHSG